MKALLTIIITSCLTLSLFSQGVTIKSEEEPLVLKVGETKQLNLVALDSEGTTLEDGQYMYQMLRQEGFVPTSGAQIDSIGNVTGRTPGNYNLIVFRTDKDNNFSKKYLQIQVVHLETSKVEIQDFPDKIYSGASFPLHIKVTDKAGMALQNPSISIESSNPKVARVDALNNFYAGEPGNGSLIINSGGITNTLQFKISKNPVVSMSIDVPTTKARTGDVLTFKAIAFDKSGKALKDIPVLYTVNSTLYESASGASAIIEPDGRFVAEAPGSYTVLATCGNVSAMTTVEIEARNISRKIELIGQGLVNTKHTSDLWVWEGVDGKDYCVTGTWMADGYAYFWDVTNPGAIKMVDSVQVDARTVNDVKVSEDGTICIISREGASNRKNGIVILDVKDPGERRSDLNL